MVPSKWIADVRGSLCPTPVIETKKLFEKHPNEVITTVVDNEVSRDNVRKFALSRGYQVNIKQEGKDYTIVMAPADYTDNFEQGSKRKAFDVSLMTMQPNQGDTQKGKVFLLTKDYLGEGSEDLGRTLMKTFLFSLSEAEVKPQKILLIHSGVKLAVENSPYLDALCALQDGGVSIEVCGICLDYYHLKDKLLIGSITNMYVIVESLTQYDAVVL